MKRLLIMVILAIFAAFPVFADANIHLSLCPKGTIISNPFDGFWKKALAGEYGKDQYIAMQVFISEVQDQGNGVTFYYDDNGLDDGQGPGGVVLIESPKKYETFHQGMRAVFLVFYLGNASITQTDEQTGEQRTITIPAFQAVAAGILLLP